ncbi:MAG: ArsR/SmtB family transcription factor [Candidatus Saccharimonadales bacterium]
MNISYDSVELDEAFGALANQSRRGIIYELSLHPDTVSSLAKQFDLTLPAIHKHIRVLENANLIIRKKHGRTNFVALNSKSLRLAQSWITQYKTEWSNPNASLENYISSFKE